MSTAIAGEKTLGMMSPSTTTSGSPSPSLPLSFTSGGMNPNSRLKSSTAILSPLTSARSEAMRLAKRELEANGFTLPEPTYRVRMAGEGTMSAPDTTTKTSVVADTQKTPVAETEETSAVNDTSPDEAVTRKIDEERTHAAKGDLLSEKDPDQLNG